MRFLIIVIALMIIAVFPASAVELISGDRVVVEEGDETDEDILAAGQSVIIRTGVNGDVAAAGQEVVVAAPVEYSTMLAGETVSSTGSIGNDVWMAGRLVRLSGAVADNAYLAGSDVRVEDDASIAGDLLAAGADVELAGDVNGNVRLAGADVTISGNVGGDAYVDAGDLRITEDARIAGDLYYESAQEAEIAPGTVAGEISRTIPPRERAQPAFWSPIVFWFGSLIAAIIFGAVLILLFPEGVQRAADTAKVSIWASLGIGLLALIVVPFVLFIVALTLIGLPLAIAAFLIWLVLLYAAQIPVALAIGQWILNRFGRPQPKRIGSMILGLIVLALVSIIPILGQLVLFFVVVIGFGAILLSWWRAHHTPTAVPPQAGPPPPPYSPETQA